MPKRKNDPCEYCNSDFIRVTSDDDSCWAPEGTELVMELYPGHHITAIATVRGNDEELGDITTAVPMHYCPNCGRKIEEY